MNTELQTPQQKAQYREVFRMRLLVLLFFTLVFALISGLILRAMLHSGVEDRHTEWSLQIGDDTASLIELSEQETGIGQTPRIDLMRLKDLLSLTVGGEMERPVVQLRQTQDTLYFADGSHLVTINDTTVFLQDQVEAHDGKIFVSISFLQEYFTGISVEMRPKTGILRISIPSEQTFGIRRI